MTEGGRPSRCERTRAWAALAPDAELSQLERRLLDAHLAHCACCRLFAEEVAAIAAELRAARFERSARRSVLPSAPVGRSAYARGRGIAAVAAVAAMAFGIGTQASVDRERQRPSAPLGSAPADVDEAELQTMRQLRQEAFRAGIADPDRPSGALGTHPA
ncbi:MAG: hypothetical protein ACXWZB_05765 [Gaiellaceae bacterium]